MLNEPPDPQRRRVHPLERPPEPPPEQQHQGQQVMLHIPYVKPYMTWLLIGINVLIFAAGWASPELQRTFFLNGANNQTEVLINGEYLRLFYAMFLHAGIAHIFFNMYSLYVIGSTVEGLFGHLRFAIIYLVGGLTGSILSVLFNGPAVNSVGASGAVFAIFGAEIVYLYHHRKLLGARGREQLRTLLIFAAMNFGIGILSSLDPGGVSIDNWGHIGGFIGGAALTWYIGPIFLLKRHPTREGAFLADDVNPLHNRYQAVALYISLLLVLLIAATFILR
jgi:rhomboid protease GluP